MTLFDIKPKLNRLPINPDQKARGRFPSWLHRPMFQGETLFATDTLIKEYGSNTVCEEAKCPNRLECFSKKTAAFLLMGKECTRACGFCEIDFAKTPKLLDEDEPLRVALSVKHLSLRHVVLTMVARDDLADGGALHLTKVMATIREHNPNVTVEVLTSDFAGNSDAWDTVLTAKPEIYNYNIETVRRLTPSVRHKATYDRTLSLLRYVDSKVPFTKSGLMVGLGETLQEVEETLRDLHTAGVDIVTIGQYLQPSKKKLVIKEFVTPETFKHYETYGLSLGLKAVYAHPFVRSSHNAEEILHQLISSMI